VRDYFNRIRVLVMCSNTLLCHGVVLVFLDDDIIYTVDVTSTYDIIMVIAYLYNSSMHNKLFTVIQECFSVGIILCRYTRSINGGCVCVLFIRVLFYFWNIFTGNTIAVND